MKFINEMLSDVTGNDPRADGLYEVRGTFEYDIEYKDELGNKYRKYQNPEFDDFVDFLSTTDGDSVNGEQPTCTACKETSDYDLYGTSPVRSDDGIGTWVY